MNCDEMTKEELVELAASDWGFSREDATKFTLNILRKACKSPQGAANYLRVNISLFKQGFLSEDKVFD